VGDEDSIVAPRLGACGAVVGGKLAAKAPAKEEVRIKGDTEKIGGNKSELRRTETDDADDGAIHRGDDPALPKLLAEQNGAEDGQHTRDIVQTDELEEVVHLSCESSRLS
jgi:hypothetical protein